MQFKGLLLAAAVAAAVVTPIAVAAAEADQPPRQKKERRICRREPTTGTRLQPPRICMTKREWDAEAERAREDMSKMQQRQVFKEATFGAPK
jgi:Ni/Co efflux regulator RcnB